MILRNYLTVMETYKGTSKFPFWKNIKVGDILEVSMELKPTGHNRGKIYAPDIKVKNLFNNESETFKDTINSVQKYFEKIKYKDFSLT